MGGDAKLIGTHAEKARNMLKNVSNLLDELGIPYVLEFGTLLGVIREGRLLPWDTDIDISITDDSLSKLIENKRRFWKLGYRTRVRYFKKNIGTYKIGDIRILKIQTRKFFFIKDKGLLDIFVLKRDTEGHTFVVGESPSVLKTIPLKYHDNTSTVNFDGKEYKIPEMYEDYLEYIYGDWRTPKKDWDFRYEGNVEIKDVK